MMIVVTTLVAIACPLAAETIAMNNSFGRSLHFAGRAEVVLVKEELDCRRVIDELTRSLTTGGARGTVEHLDLSAVRIDGLVDAASAASSLGLPTDTAQQLFSAVQVFVQLRKLALDRDWTALDTTLVGNKDLLGLSGRSRTVLPDVAAAEVQLLVKTVEDRKLQEKLRAVLASGGAGGDIGHLNLTRVDVGHVEAALQAARLR